MNKKEMIIKSIGDMDTQMLEMLLDESKTYQEATKTIFITKLEDAFSKLKEKGDKRLLVYEGICNSDFCSNNGCKGYSFFGETSRMHIDLIIQEEGGEVMDIFHCNGLDVGVSPVKRSDLIYIDIRIDEKANFKPDIDYLIKSQKCELAYQELAKYKDQIIDKTIYLFWLNQFEDLYNSFHSRLTFYSSFYKFLSLYSELNALKKYLKVHPKAKKAIDEFFQIDLKCETSLLKWLVTYEKYGEQLTLLLYEDENYELAKKRQYFYVFDFKIDTKDFDVVIAFEELFNKHYWEMLSKYTTFNNSNTQVEDEETLNNASKLSYHLGIRGIQFD